MKTIKLILLALIFISTQVGYAQNKLIKKGDKQYFGYNYSGAIRYYEPVINKTIETERILAVCYEMTGQLDKAKNQYDSISKNPQRTFKDLWSYFLVLLKLENYEKAVELLNPMAKLKPDDSRVKAYLAETDFYKKLKPAQPAFELRNLEINNEQQDFGTVYFKDKIVFASSRNQSGLFNRFWNGNHLHFLKIYMTRPYQNNELSELVPFHRKLNRKYHDGPVCFNADGTVMALTRDNYNSKSADGTRNLQLFTSEFINGAWTDPISFPFNNPEYSIGQATFTPDGKYMYFASDMPGGKGGTDIYKVERRTDGTWGNLINLEAINTEGDEMFPYYNKNGILFFSSNGRVGLGGLDVYMVSVKDDKYGAVRNLEAPINTSADDFALLLDDKLQIGYLSSNRKGGKGSDDIYFVKALKPLKSGKMIKGVTKDKQNTIIPYASVCLLLNNDTVEKKLSDSLGRYEFYVDKETLYRLNGTKTGYFEGNNTANTNVPEDIIYADLILDKIPNFSLYVLVISKKTKQPLDSVKISLSNNLTDKNEIIYTSKKGDFRTGLPDKKINDRISYNLKLEKSGYLTKTITNNQTLTKEGEYKIIDTLDPLVELKVGDDLAKLFSINPIYFDLNKFNIRGDASFELDKIVAIMNAYPTVVIELGSHTDCRASYAYNMKLSDNRAKASAAYIKQRITNPDRIYGKGYGESKLVNRCACEGNVKSDCTEEEHQKNRRTEFIIIKQ